MSRGGHAMARKRRKRSVEMQGECVYCDFVGTITDDHIPSENLFSKPRPNNLIKVPSCFPCNNGFSKDDEYFRLMIIMRNDIGSHAEYNKIWPVVHKSLKRPGAQGFANALIQNMALSDVQSTSGLYLGRMPTYPVDFVRLDRVAARIAQGLYYRETERRLRDDYCVVAYNPGSTAGNVAGNGLIQSNCKKLTSSKPTTIGNGVFSYWFQRTKDDPYMSACLMEFFGKVQFFCVTVPKTLAAKRRYVFNPNPVIIT
jgi:hypothetical protein